MDDLNYTTFSESEAPDHLRQCLDYFFSDDDGKKRYKFSDAYLKFSKFANDDFITSKRIYNIIKTTSLIHDKLVLRVNTLTGDVYMIENKYFDKVQRHVRLLSRKSMAEPITTPTNTQTSNSRQASPPSGFAQPQLDDNSTTDHLSIEETWQDMNKKVDPDQGKTSYLFFTS